jgi:hypothetical protein
VSVTVHCPRCGFSNAYRSAALAEAYLARHSCRRRLEARARAAAAERRAAARAIQSECRHTRVHHQHGTREAYVLDRCRCPACSGANTIAERDRRRAHVYGRARGNVPADEARDHLRSLTAAGIGVKQAALLSGVAYSTLARLLWGDAGRGKPPNQHVRASTAARILAIEASAANLADGGRVDATGTRRRLQALITIGWTRASLARQLHRSTASVRRTLTSASVTVATAEAVRDLYDQLWNTAPDESTPARHNASEAARIYAGQHGWLPPMAWDDIDTDPEPAPRQPDSSRTQSPDDIDDFDIEIAIERLIAGQPVRLSTAERDEVIRRLTDRGHSLEQIARSLGVCSRTVSRRRAAA